MSVLRRSLAALTALGLIVAGALGAAAAPPTDPTPAVGPSAGSTEVQVELPPVHVTSVSAGISGYAALDSEGQWWTWGRNQHDQLLRPGTDEVLAPAPVTSGLADGLVQLTIGDDFGAGVTADGRVKVWGSNFNGQLGQDPTGLATSAVPLEVPLPAGAVSVSLGDSSVYALLSDGTVWAWGDNGIGELGNDSLSYAQTVPTQVPVPVPVSAVGGGNGFGAALGVDGNVYTWGAAVYGTLGRDIPGGLQGYDAMPTAVPGLTGVTDLSVGEFTIGALSAGQVWAWGDNSYAQIGNGSTGSVVESPYPVAIPATVTTLAVSASNMTVIDDSGMVWAWGLGYYGTLGDGSSTMFATTPVHASTTAGLGLVHVIAGEGVTFGTDAQGRLYGWGVNDLSQLGSTDFRYTASAALVDLGLTATALTFDGQPGTEVSTTWPHASALTPPHATGPAEVTVSAVDRNGNPVPDWTYPAGFTYQATVSFDSRGGSAVDPTLVSTATVDAPVDPTLAEHAFAGWTLDPAGQYPWDPTAALIDDLTVYAQWTAVTVPGPGPEPSVPPTEGTDDTGTSTPDRPFQSAVLAADQNDTVVPDGTVLATTGQGTGLAALALALLLSGTALVLTRRQSA